MPCPAIIIPVHNRREITRRCLAHLQAQAIPSWSRVIVVDDGSSDGTARMLLESYPWVQVLDGGGDLWWAGAIHLGMRHAIAEGADCICWLNDDTLPDAGTLALLVRTARSRQAVCGAVCRAATATATAYSGGWMIDGWPAPMEDPPPPGAEVAVDWLHGNLVVMPAAVWQRLGLPECRWMRHNLSDIEYTWRAHQHGIPILLLPQAGATAAVNRGISYRSWADPAVSARALIAGLWQPRVWWYAPGLAFFLVRLHGKHGAWLWLRMIAKVFATAFLKCLLPARWVAWIKACKGARPAQGKGRNPIPRK